MMIDDYRPDKIDQIILDTRAYIDRNIKKFEVCARRLMEHDVPKEVEEEEKER